MSDRSDDAAEALVQARIAWPVGAVCRVPLAQGAARTYLGVVRDVFYDSQHVICARLLVTHALNPGGLDIPPDYSEPAVPITQLRLWHRPNA
jgi:hypothetical protein